MWQRLSKLLYGEHLVQKFTACLLEKVGSMGVAVGQAIYIPDDATSFFQYFW